ncbi:hypothetical protein ACIRIR_35920 [Streptomyces globisporus]|uniref:hypothetical protein n=1 Tax=Streptomyces globisporus TaxID=1908 RepID=UPI0037F7C1DB
MALTRYRFDFVGTTGDGDLAEGTGHVEAENPQIAEAMVIGFAKGREVEPARIDLTVQV